MCLHLEQTPARLGSEVSHLYLSAAHRNPPDVEFPDIWASRPPHTNTMRSSQWMKSRTSCKPWCIDFNISDSSSRCPRSWLKRLDTDFEWIWDEAGQTRFFSSPWIIPELDGRNLCGLVEHQFHLRLQKVSMMLHSYYIILCTLRLSWLIFANQGSGCCEVGLLPAIWC